MEKNNISAIESFKKIEKDLNNLQNQVFSVQDQLKQYP